MMATALFLVMAWLGILNGNPEAASDHFTEGEWNHTEDTDGTITMMSRKPLPDVMQRLVAELKK